MKRIDFKNIKRINKKKVGFVIAIAVFLLFSAYSAVALQKDPETITSQKVGRYIQRGVFQHKAFFSNTSLYGDVKSMKYYPKDITESISGVYVYTFTPGDDITGKYKLTIVTTYYISKGKEKIVLWEDKLVEREGELENGMMGEAITFNMKDMNRRMEAVKEGLGVRRISRETKIVVQVLAKGKVNGKYVKEEFDQTINMVIDSGNGLIYFTNDEVEAKKNIIDKNVQVNYVSFLGKPITVAKARKLFPILALLSALPIFGMVYTEKTKTPRDELKDLRRYMIEGIPNKVDKKITLATEEDLKRTFELIDKPIMHYQEGNSDVYAIVDNGVVYEYRRDN
ncbi:DUF5305 family protein [Thermococcus sp. SY098]|uniref:DUF5305 family protein n=1 Tax=Thermococcus sp. SY098 TaxID=3111325 RepID=UPI002D77BD01|nr:DUF5305 family protein [Thermococcus sp. SY098]WRS52033.1 DUF5305 family protein [Thermococcus sp. SY098]